MTFNISYNISVLIHSWKRSYNLHEKSGQNNKIMENYKNVIELE